MWLKGANCVLCNSQAFFRCPGRRNCIGIGIQRPNGILKLHSALPYFTVSWEGLKGLLYQFFLETSSALRSETSHITNIKRHSHFPIVRIYYVMHRKKLYKR